MSQVQMRGDVICEQCNIQVPQTLKRKAKELGVNITQVTITALEAEVKRLEAGQVK